MTLATPNTRGEEESKCGKILEKYEKRKKIREKNKRVGERRERKKLEGMEARDAWIGDIVGEIRVVGVETSFPYFDRFCTPLTTFVIYSVGTINAALTSTEHFCKHMP